MRYVQRLRLGVRRRRRKTNPDKSRSAFFHFLSTSKVKGRKKMITALRTIRPSLHACTRSTVRRRTRMAPRGNSATPGGPRGTPSSARSGGRPSSPGGGRDDSSYDSEDDEGPTIFGSVLRTIMAGAAVVAIAVLVGSGLYRARRPSPISLFRLYARFPENACGEVLDVARNCPAHWGLLFVGLLCNLAGEGGELVTTILPQGHNNCNWSCVRRYPKAKIERDQRYGAPPPSSSAYRLPPPVGAAQVESSRPHSSKPPGSTHCYST
jgi:hypothetical protein